MSQEVFRIDAKAEKIALFRFGVIAPLVLEALPRGELTRRAERLPPAITTSQSGYAIVMGAHNPDHAFLSATHAAVLSGGRIVALGDPHSVITSESLSRLYAARIQVVTASLPGEPSAEVKVYVPLI